MPRNSSGHLIPGVINNLLTVPSTIARPEYVGKAAPSKNTLGDRYNSEEIEKIRHSSRIAANALDAVTPLVQPGITTQELDAFIHDYLINHNAYPSTLGYRGFPRSSCTSLNEVICHGIPDDTVLIDGDILNIDVTAFVDGYHGDTNRMYGVGDVSEEAELLMQRTKEALQRAINAVKPGREVNIIGRVIESYAKRFDYGVVRDFTGHGVGRAFHTGLIIPHYDAPDDYRDVIEPGMVFTIEPMLTIGGIEWDMWDDGWTVTTQDKSLTAQYEHTILVTDTSAEILTNSLLD